MMTAKTRRLVSDDFGPSDNAGSIAAGSGNDAPGQAAIGGSTWPFNDNSRSDGIHSEDLSSNDASERWADRPTAESDDASTGGQARAASAEYLASLSARRRGPLVTRWIGFAARRRRAQARASRIDQMNDRPSGTGSATLDH